MTNRRRNIGIICLMMGTFLNPFGYAEAVAGVMELTGWDYWTTTHFFYVLAASFYLGWLFFLRINPFKLIKDRAKRIVKLFKKIEI